MTEGSESDAGYKRPPKHSQFRPGQSGNLSGRPKHVRNFQTELDDELKSPIIVTEGGRKVEVSKQRAIIKTLIAAAIEGDIRAATALLSLCARTATKDEERDPSPEELEILESFHHRERERGELPAAAPDSPHPNSERNGDEP